ncbi:MAG: hypothetical protein ACOY3D_03840 [Candidatus Omnitrophota bacterium]
MYRKHKRSAQSTLEYAVLIVLVAVALLATQTYIKRAMQGRLKSSADDVGEQFSPGAAVLTTNIQSSTSTNESSVDGVTTSRMLGADSQTRVVDIDIGGYESEYWPGAANAT